MKNKYELLDGNTATAKIAFMLSEFASIYPITPSTPMAEYYEQQCALKEKNIFDKVPECVQMQSEAGVAGALHGALSAGALSTTFTCSQGLLLMIPNMYKIAGEGLPCVIHVAARTIATHALNIFGDHSDVMACSQTGFALLCANNVQECADLATIAHIATYKAQVPFLHFFDGFRTSHEMQKIILPNSETLRALLPNEEISAFKKRALSSASPSQHGTAQNPDVFFQNRQASLARYENLPVILQSVMNDFARLTGRQYNLYEYVGNKNAKNVIVIMGSGAETIEEILPEYDDVGLLKVRLFSPFAKQEFLNSLPKNVQNICVLDRCLTSNHNGEPLYKEVISALSNKTDINFYNGSYGVGGKDFTADMARSVIDNMVNGGKKFFTVGINDDVTNTNIDIVKHQSNEHYNILFYGVGSDGMVSASKNTLKIISELTNYNVQGFFEYDSKKSGGITISHIRISDKPIKSTYKIQEADCIVLADYDYLSLIDVCASLKQNATLLINTPFDEQLTNEKLSPLIKNTLSEKNIKVFAINAYKYAQELGLKNKINTLMQSAFFATSTMFDAKIIKEHLITITQKTFAKKGENVLQANLNAIDCGFNFVKEIKITKQNTQKDAQKQNYDNFMQQVLMRGDNVKVSEFNPYGEVKQFTSNLDKRDMSKFAPQYISENCLQCNLCALACPHSVIRPKLIKDDVALPANLKVLKSKVLEGYNFTIYVDTKHCTGCGVCESVCPAKQKALMLKNKESLTYDDKTQNFLNSIKNPTDKLDKYNLRQSQFFEPYFKYCGACAGCGEAPYIKLLTQLYGDNLIIANATGCSSIYSASYPTCPFDKNQNGNGPAWANSLFEDNAEFGLGIKYGKEINNKKDCVFIVGGDGWAYDIGYGGLDHVLSSGKNINILVLDTELYSNTGGQCSKATQKGVKCKFNSNGKQTNKKPLGVLAMAYQNVFVAQVNLGANPKQCLEVFKNAVEYDGVSLIIAYCPCINHGKNMAQSHETAQAVTLSGAFPLYTYNPKAQTKFVMQSSTECDNELYQTIKAFGEALNEKK